MVRATEIQERLLHLIGWQQNYNTEELKIAEELTESESGLYFQQLHPLITLQNLACVAPLSDVGSYPKYKDNKTYTKGQIVRFNDKLYKAKQITKGIPPTGEGANLLGNSSFEEWTYIEEGTTLHQQQTPVGFIGETEKVSEATKLITNDSYSGEHALYINKGVDNRLAYAVHLKPGHYEFSIYAKVKEPFNKDGEPNSILNLGVCSYKNDGYRSFRYKDASPITSSDWVRYTYEFDIDKDTEEWPGINDLLILIKKIKSPVTIDNICLIQQIGYEPSDYWEETNPFSEWLRQKTIASIQKVVYRFLNEKLAKSANKTLLESKTLFNGTGRIFDTVKNKKRLVGFEIVPIRAKGVTTKINKIGLQFTEPGEYKLYLYHSSCDEPIREFTFTKTKKNTLEWFKLDDVFLPYESENIDAGGSWYLCYYQSELPKGSQAIRKDKDWSKGPCKSCSREEFLSWSAWSKYLEIHPFHAAEDWKQKLIKPAEYTSVQISQFAGLYIDRQYLPSGPFSVRTGFNTESLFNSFVEKILGITTSDTNNIYNWEALSPYPKNYKVISTRISIDTAKSAYITIDNSITEKYVGQSIDAFARSLSLSNYITDELHSSRVYKEQPVEDTSRGAYKEINFWIKRIHKDAIYEDYIDKTLWDIENNIYTYDTNYGINLDISISCDMTDFIIEQRHLFQDVIGKQLAVDMLREFAYNANVRTNRHTINASKMDIMYELDGDASSFKKSGLSYQLDEAYKALSISTEGISRVCLPCVNNGVKYRTV